MTFFY